MSEILVHPGKPDLAFQSNLVRRYNKEISDPVSLFFTAESGLPVQVFDDLIKITGLNKNQLAGFIDMTAKTIDNYHKRKKPFRRIQSEQLLQILALYKKGLDIFGSTGEMNVWLCQPAPGLGGRMGMDMLYSQGGIQLVMEELIRLEYGALA
jgi:putative toxin-antitoxin system antitoxin component (TIGR02293 family)